MHFTLKTDPLRREDLDEFVACYFGMNGNGGNPPSGPPSSKGGESRHDRRPTWSAEPEGKAGTGPEGRWRAYTYDELINRDKSSLDIFWLKDESLSDSDNLPAPDLIAQEIVDDLEAALEQFRLIAGDLGEGAREAAD